MNRCTLIPELCQPAAGAPAPDTTATTDNGKATDTDNGKKQKCNCCTCVQKSKSLIECTTAAGTTSFTGGLSLAAQCDACGKDANICKNAKEAQRQIDTNKAIDDARNNEKGKVLPGITKPAKCGSGFHFTDKNVCVKNSSNSNPKPDPITPGCKKGQHCNFTFTNTQAICHCSNYARAFYGIPGSRSFFSVPANNGYKVFRNRISFK